MCDVFWCCGVVGVVFKVVGVLLPGIPLTSLSQVWDTGEGHAIPCFLALVPAFLFATRITFPTRAKKPRRLSECSTAARTPPRSTLHSRCTTTPRGHASQPPVVDSKLPGSSGSSAKRRRALISERYACTSAWVPQTPRGERALLVSSTNQRSISERRTSVRVIFNICGFF